MPKLLNISKSVLAAKRLEHAAICCDPPPPISKLLTRQQVIERIKLEIAKSSLTEVAAAHQLSPQQLSDCMYNRANLSRTMLEKLGWCKWEFFQKVGE